jgi:hypothetical protein
MLAAALVAPSMAAAADGTNEAASALPLVHWKDIREVMGPRTNLWSLHLNVSTNYSVAEALPFAPDPLAEQSEWEAAILGVPPPPPPPRWLVSVTLLRAMEFTNRYGLAAEIQCSASLTNRPQATSEKTNKMEKK